MKRLVHRSRLRHLVFVAHPVEWYKPEVGGPDEHLTGAKAGRDCDLDREAGGAMAPTVMPGGRTQPLSPFSSGFDASPWTTHR
eukprot:CAMPEP_0181178540 /NCGR_PEP_ID=MMETSP1096-20121128/5775_1 /TAXON_ID=156174 ORGANISM="Chrysochromulina ericina, Strain CCMP281" /NCGR_SAMPLE_ID=MMETSP1096 /ASSEMBLY_ACC=CAM_ASM_000453 /LENGTH=82 /DNA_ID=CAMNT_0023266817 /DNA_START=540 /DNA_END=786 /DNA_ORIENTATION=+